jgi:hypothetical protein
MFFNPQNPRAKHCTQHIFEKVFLPRVCYMEKQTGEGGCGWRAFVLQGKSKSHYLLPTIIHERAFHSSASAEKKRSMRKICKPFHQYI